MVAEVVVVVGVSTAAVLVTTMTLLLLSLSSYNKERTRTQQTTSAMNQAVSHSSPLQKQQFPYPEFPVPGRTWDDPEDHEGQSGA